MDFPLSRDFFVNNRKRLVEQLPEGSVVVVPAHTRVQRNGDVAFRFRQNSNFFYLTGINDPDCLLVLSAHVEWLVIPNRDKTHALWEGQTSAQVFRRISGITNVIQRQQFEKSFSKIIGRSSTIYLPRVTIGNHHGIAINAALPKTEQWLRKKIGRKRLKDIRPALAKLRVIKQPAEIECIKRAISITKEGLRAATKAIKPGVREIALVAKFAQPLWSKNVGEAFPSIVAAGQNACIIHYHTGTAELKKGELLLFDVGAEYQNYAADISRTYPVSGKFTSRQKQIHDAVKQMQAAAMAILKTGVLLKDYEGQVAELMKEKLVDLKLLKKSSPIKSVRRYFPHGTSHFLGLDVHDVGDYKKPLEPGMVLTVEPGIYIPEEGIGVRIEDDVLITKDGIQNLSASIK